MASLTEEQKIKKKNDKRIKGIIAFLKTEGIEFDVTNTRRLHDNIWSGLNQIIVRSPYDTEKLIHCYWSQIDILRIENKPYEHISKMITELKLDRLRQEYNMSIYSDRKKSITLLLCFFFGVFGVHRFYVRKYITGTIYLFTFGLLFLGAMRDFWSIIMNRFKDNLGRDLI